MKAKFSDWRNAIRQGTPEAYQAFLENWRDGTYAEKARDSLNKLTEGLVEVQVGTGDRQTETRWIIPGATFYDFRGAPEMVVIPTGSFLMGTEGEAKKDEYGADERPRHAVQICHAFAVGKYPVTFDEWEMFHNETSTRRAIEDEGWGGGTTANHQGFVGKSSGICRMVVTQDLEKLSAVE